MIERLQRDAAMKWQRRRRHICIPNLHQSSIPDRKTKPVTTGTEVCFCHSKTQGGLKALRFRLPTNSPQLFATYSPHAPTAGGKTRSTSIWPTSRGQHGDEKIMMARLSAAWTRAFAEVWPDDWGIYKAIGALWVLGVIFCGFFFAVHDHGRVNILVSFVGGLVTGVFLFTHIRPNSSVAFSCNLPFKTDDRSRRTDKASSNDFFYHVVDCSRCPVDECDSRFVKTLPVVGDQITFMFRDEDDD